MIYKLAIRRIVRVSIIATVIGVLCTFALRGPRAAAGFLAGAAISALNLWGLVTVVNSLGGSRIGASAILFFLRYLLIAGGVYVIVKLLNITPGAVFVGLLVTTAAVVVEALYELVASE
jgi:hypothetical protein